MFKINEIAGNSRDQRRPPIYHRRDQNHAGTADLIKEGVRNFE
jgi:hypothetical protein